MINTHAPTPVSLPELFAPVVPKTFFDPATMRPHEDGVFVSVSLRADRANRATARAVDRHVEREAGKFPGEIAVAAWWRRDLGVWMVDACARFDELEVAVELGRGLGWFEIDVVVAGEHHCLPL